MNQTIWPPLRYTRLVLGDPHLQSYAGVLIESMFQTQYDFSAMDTGYTYVAMIMLFEPG